MRSSMRLLAKVQPGRFLEANTPTGLTGLTTHPSPRPALILTYRQTLDKLKSLPESSIYRQSTEALTKHRLKILEETKPAGFEEWLGRIQKAVAAHPDEYAQFRRPDGTFSHEQISEEKAVNWDGEERVSLAEGDYTEPAANERARKVAAEVEERDAQMDEGKPTIEDLEPEPPLDAQQISDIENKIAAGLIEEVVMVAEGELVLVEEMAQSKVWEDLVEKAAPGQWTYFERDPRGV